jgi:hypothetical protein
MGDGESGHLECCMCEQFVASGVVLAKASELEAAGVKVQRPVRLGTLTDDRGNS